MKKHLSIILAAIMLLTCALSAPVSAATEEIFSCNDAAGYKTFVRSTLTAAQGIGGRALSDISARIEPDVKERDGDTVYTGYTDFIIGSVTDGKWSCADRSGYLVTEGSFMPINGAKLRIATSGSAYFSPNLNALQDRWNKFYAVYDFDNAKVITVTNGVRDKDQTTVFGTVRNASSGTYYDAIRPIVTTDVGSGGAVYLDDFKLYFSDTLPDFAAPPALDNSVCAVKGGLAAAAGKRVSDISCDSASVIVFADDTFSAPLSDSDTIAEGNIIVLQSENGCFTYYTAVTEFAREPVKTYAMYSDADTLGKMPMLRMKNDVEYGIGGKSPIDAVGKFTATELTGDNSYTFFTNTSIDSALSEGKVTVTLSVYPNETVNGIYFATNGHAALSQNIPNILLNANSWNKLSIVYDPDTQSSALYINDVYQSTTKRALGTVLRVVFSVCTQNFSDGYIYYDDMAIYSGEVFYPTVTFDKYTLDGVSLHGYGGDTAGDLAQNASFAVEGYSLAVYSADGALRSDSDKLEHGDDVRIYDGDSMISHYSLGTPTFTAIGGGKVISDGYVSSTGKYGSGNVELCRTVASYDKSRDIIVAAALCGADGSLKKITLTPQTINGIADVKANIDITETEGTRLKLIIMESGTLVPLCGSEEFSPYSADKIEVAAPLYEGYTTKAAVFNYDDCVPSDIRMVKLLNKYNMKGTFNLVGKNVLGRLRSECLAQTGKSDDASVFEFAKSVYDGQEISSHTFNHYPAHLNPGEESQDSKGNKLVGASTEAEVSDITSCVTYLEENLGADDVIGLAWPNGYGTQRDDYESDLLPAMKEIGIKYARGAENGSFSLPEDWYVWNATCHHRNAPTSAKAFVAMANEGELKCFFNWGHTYEFDEHADDDSLNWNMIEGVMQTLSEDNIWFATNGDIYRYAEAAKKAVVTDTAVENKSDIRLYFNINGKNVEIAPGETYKIN